MINQHECNAKPKDAVSTDSKRQKVSKCNKYKSRLFVEMHKELIFGVEEVQFSKDLPV
jgi:hypothetical protein